MSNKLILATCTRLVQVQETGPARTPVKRPFNQHLMARGLTKESLEQQLEELTEEYNRLEASFKSQKEKLRVADERRAGLSSLLTEANATKSDLQKRVNILSEDKRARRIQLKNETDRMTRETEAYVKVLLASIRESETISRMLKMRIGVVTKKWQETEFRYLQKISELDQELLMTQAKREEVKNRMLALQKGHEYVDDLAKSLEMLELFSRAADRESLVLGGQSGSHPEQLTEKKQRLSALREHLVTLERQCREIRDLRDNLIEQTNANEQE